MLMVVVVVMLQLLMMMMKEETVCQIIDVMRVVSFIIMLSARSAKRQASVCIVCILWARRASTKRETFEIAHYVYNGEVRGKYVNACASVCIKVRIRALR